MKIGVYGLGRFGSFWAALMAREFNVIAYNRSADRALPEGVTRCTIEQLCEVDVLFLCVAISSLESVLTTIGPRLKPGCVVMDTCSVKVYPSELMERLLPSGIHAIATHPMFGPDSGRDGVKGLPMVYAPLRCPQEIADYWHTVFSEVFELRVLVMTPDEHDREAAFTQGITHVIGRVLGELELKKSSIGTAGYNSLLEIIEQTCNDPMQLFFDLQRYNPHTREMHMKLNDSLEHVMRQLERADTV
jgi:prephenate dehydrogenase